MASLAGPTREMEEEKRIVKMARERQALLSGLVVYNKKCFE